MQTFVAFDDFGRSAAVLDNRRLQCPTNNY